MSLGRDETGMERRDGFSFAAPRLVTHSAYLVAVFKLAGEPQIPTFVGVGIFSEPEPTVGSDRRCWLVYRVDDVSYSEAKHRLLLAVRSSPELMWAAPHLRERDLL